MYETLFQGSRRWSSLRVQLPVKKGKPITCTELAIIWSLGFAWSTLKAIGVRDFHLGSAGVACDSKTTNASSENAQACSDKPHVPTKLPETTNSPASEANLMYKALSNLKTSPRHDMVMVFTCKVCETRSYKPVCRESYEKGVVVARCGGCNNIHLMSDHLGWFGEPGSVEELLAARGEEVQKGSMDTLSLTLDDLAGAGTKLS